VKLQSWLFKKLNLSLRLEVITNISLLMLVAILLIGFTISKMNERNILQEKIRSGEGMVKDFQTIIDFLARGQRGFSLADLGVKKELQDFVSIYARERSLDDVTVVDTNLKVVTSRSRDGTGRLRSPEKVKEAMQSGLLSTEIEKTGGFITAEYKTLTLYAPLWVQGRVAGGLRVQVPIADVMVHLLRSQRVLLFSIILDALVLIAFGSLLLSRVLVKPLKDLVQLTKRISEGHFHESIEVTSTNEIGQLITSFNRMLERLKVHQEDLENYLRSLESANKQLKQAQEELVRSEKLASIGRFAAGVAHEVGNPLGAILGYTSMLQKNGFDAEESKDYLKRIEKEIQRINRIVRELLDFARPSRGEIREVEINVVVENALSLLSYQKSFRNIETRLGLQPDLPRVRGDESQLSQVFINLILNAVDAMPSGGVLKIETENYVVEELPVDHFRQFYSPRRSSDPEASDYSHLRKPNPLSAILSKFSRGERLVKVRVSDTGVGIKREDIERIFDPFFTTKPPDKGTGLGLSISLKIVETMGGIMRVESEVGMGAIFEIFFPTVPGHDQQA
jgi:two-component system NtrC family sensor kinase